MEEEAWRWRWSPKCSTPIRYSGTGASEEPPRATLLQKSFERMCCQQKCLPHAWDMTHQGSSELIGRKGRIPGQRRLFQWSAQSSVHCAIVNDNFFARQDEDFKRIPFSRRPGKDEEADGNADCSNLSGAQTIFRLYDDLWVCHSRLIEEVKPEEIQCDWNHCASEDAKKSHCQVMRNLD